jgi:hypothetical protein
MNAGISALAVSRALLRDKSSSEEEMSQPLANPYGPRQAVRAEEGGQKTEIPGYAFRCDLFLFRW